MSCWSRFLKPGLLVVALTAGSLGSVRPAHAEEARFAEAVRFTGGDRAIALAGTLERPAHIALDQPLPAVVLIHGSGPNDRDETMYGHKPFRLLSAWLTEAGYAVLRYDKRGVGESGGTAQGATIVDFAADAEAAFDFLRSRPDIDGHRIGLLGHSEGGMVAPLIAARRPEVAWLVLLAPPTVNGREISRYQNTQGALDRGASSPDAEAAAEEATGLFDIVTSGIDSAERDSQLLAALNRLADRRRLSAAMVEAQRASLASAWFRHILAYDPAPTLRQLRAPTLVLFAALDHQIAPALNEAPARAALQDNPAAEVRVLPGVNHLFLRSSWGAVAEYPRVAPGLAPVLHEALDQWLERIDHRQPTYTARR
ncbi:MAG: alpha/beta hydrolase family protein [Nevskia sp.]|uniref:alpha/beta hydrolase family protein n=1 Tax=Nevskia sp. TaxID=1929292 RepID=UPI0040354342